MAHYFGLRYLKRSHENHIDNNLDIYNNDSLLFIFMAQILFMIAPEQRNESFLSPVVIN